MKSTLSGWILLALSTPALGLPQSSGARDRAMGGVGVASSHYSTAGLTNPALLSHFGNHDDFAIVMPFFDAVVADGDQLLDAVDEFQATLNQIQALIDIGDVPSLVAANALRPMLGQQLQSLEGRTLAAAFGTGLSVSLPSEGLALAVVARSYVEAQAFPVIDPADVALISAPFDGSTDLDTDIASEAVVLAAGVLEVGLTASYKLELMGRPFSVGITPKVQRVETFNYAIGIQSFNDDNALDDYSDDIYRQDETNVNVDVGIAFEASPLLTVGLVARDLISDKVNTVSTSGRTFSYELGPRFVGGVAFRSQLFTVAADVDLTVNDRFDRTASTRFIRLGAEFDAFGWLKVRGGFAHDLEDTVTDLFSAGVGFAPFKVFNLDLVGLVGEDSVGAGIQISFTI